MEKYHLTPTLTVDPYTITQVGNVSNGGKVYLSELFEVPGHYGLWVTFKDEPTYIGFISKSGRVFILHEDVTTLSASMFPLSYPIQFEVNVKEMLAPFMPGLFPNSHKAVSP